jgi:cell division protein FtsW (lipid II flippase)
MTGGLHQLWDLRSPERHLLLGCLLCVTIGFVLILGSKSADGRPVALADLRPLALYAVSLIAVHATLILSRFRGDALLPALVAFLAGLGLLAQYRMGTFDNPDPLAPAHYVFAAGVLVMLGVTVAGMRGRYQALAAGLWVWGGLSLLLVAAVLLTGQRFRGGVYASGFVTPTELLKVTVPLFLAAFIDRNAKALATWTGRVPLPPYKDLAPLIGFWVLLAGLLFMQRDLGMFVILSVALLALLVVGTGRIAYLVYGLVAASGLGYLVLGLFLHGQRRIETWLDPFQDPTGDSWQVLQGLSGMYSGGLWGEGFGQGNPEYTPIAESDFIYSVIGEELGFVGCVVVVLFFLILFARGLQIAVRARSDFGMLLGAGLTTVIATQTFLNVGGVTKLIPLTGITLPFISHGGSSLLTAFAALGLILAISDGEPAQPRRKAAQPGPSRPRASPKSKPAARKRTPRATPGKPTSAVQTKAPTSISR